MTDMQCIDKIFADIGYTVASVNIHDAASIMSETHIEAFGTVNALSDKNDILQRLGRQGLQITKFSIGINRNLSPVNSIGSRTVSYINGIEDITLSVSCYTESIPKDVQPSKNITPPISDNNPNFDLSGAL